MRSKTKILNRLSKKPLIKSSEDNLMNQYKIIRSDILKLRSDLSKGYDMAREMMDKKKLVKIIRGEKK